MNNQDKNLLTRIYDQKIKGALSGQIASQLSGFKIDDKNETLPWYGVFDVFIGACGIGVPTGKPKVKLSRLSLSTETDKVNASDLSFPGPESENQISFTLDIEAFNMFGNFKFEQPCFQFLPPAINNACATTKALNIMAEKFGNDVNSDENLEYLRELREKLKKTKVGSVYVGYYERNHDEISRLLDTNDQVKKIFESADALNLVNNVLLVARNTAGVTLDGNKLSKSLPAMAFVLSVNGSSVLKQAVSFAKAQIPLYKGMDLKEILAKLEGDTVDISLHDYNEAELLKEPKEYAMINEAGEFKMASSMTSPRTKSGTFTDEIKNTELQITGTLDFSGDKPVFALFGDDPISVDLGAVDVGITIQPPPTQAAEAIGDVFAGLMAKWFGPNKTSNEIKKQFKSDEMKKNITTMVNSAIEQNWI